MAAGELINIKEMNGIRFNKKELIAILNIAHGMIDADGQTKEIEIEVLLTQMKRFGLDYDEFINLNESAILEMDPRSAICIVSEMNTIQKQYVQALLIIIMVSDGEIHEREMTLLRFVTMACGLPPVNMNDINTTLNAFKSRTI